MINTAELYILILISVTFHFIVGRKGVRQQKVWHLFVLQSSEVIWMECDMLVRQADLMNLILVWHGLINI